ncbi:MAG TPA: hypothetical protein VE988_26635 [Gemmataceae bacterium]|nr:hypothetical protein [Gemmataceae bacterium]
MLYSHISPSVLPGELLVPSILPHRRFPGKLPDDAHYPPRSCLSAAFGLKSRDGDYSGYVLNRVAFSFWSRIRQRIARRLMSRYQLIMPTTAFSHRLDHSNCILAPGVMEKVPNTLATSHSK